MTLITWNGSSTTVWATGANWVGSSAPGASGDSAAFDQTSTTNGVAGSDQSATVLDDLFIKAAFTKTFGDAAGGTKLKVKATRVRIGDPSGASGGGNGAGRINLDLSTTASTITVIATASTGTDSNVEPVRIVGVNSSNKISVLSGRVGIATDANSDLATFGDIGCLGSDAVMRVASGVTLTNFRQTAGTATLYCAMTLLAQDGGTVTTYGSGAITTAQINGTAYLCSSGTITTLEIMSSGAVDLTRSITARTITTVKMVAGAELTYDPAIITITNPIQVLDGTLDDVKINVPPGITVAIAAV